MKNDTKPTDQLSPSQLNSKLTSIEDQISKISAKEVLFIISLSFISIIVLINLILLLLDRRRKKKQNDVPQAIVIQPNLGSNSGGQSGEKAGKSEKSRVSIYEKDVLPSKSMKMKVSIAGGQQSKSTKADSKETITDEPLQVPIPIPAPPKPTTPTPSTPVVTAAVVSPMVATAQTSSNPAQVIDITLTSSAPIPPSPLSTKSNEQPVSKPGVSSSSMTSFTVQEDGLTSHSKSSSAPIALATPTVTTLSGNEASRVQTVSISALSPQNLAKKPSIEMGNSPKPQAAPAATPSDVKKVAALFPQGCGTMV